MITVQNPTTTLFSSLPLSPHIMYLPGIIIRYIFSWLLPNVTEACRCRRVCKSWRIALSPGVLECDGGFDAVHLTMGTQIARGSHEMAHFFGSRTKALALCGISAGFQSNSAMVMEYIDAIGAQLKTFTFRFHNVIERVMFDSFIARMPNLTKLELSMHTFVSEAGYRIDPVTMLLECFQGTPHIKHLVLRENDLRNDDLLAIVAGCPDLTTLDVQHAIHITPSFVSSVARSGSKLVVLDLSFCRWVCDDDVRLFRRDHPDLTIIAYEPPPDAHGPWISFTNKFLVENGLMERPSRDGTR